MVLPAILELMRRTTQALGYAISDEAEQVEPDQDVS
jgi:hypothetical protein